MDIEAGSAIYFAVIAQTTVKNYLTIFFHLVASVTDEVGVVFISVLHLVCLACTSKEVKSQRS